MEKSKLHSMGQNDYLESLKKKYNSLRKKVMRNKKMTETEKNVELKSLTESFEKEKKSTDSNLY